jgi:hypothetical protein
MSFLLIEGQRKGIVAHFLVCQQQTQDEVVVRAKVQRAIVDHHNPVLIVIADRPPPDELAAFEHGSHSLLCRKSHFPAFPITERVSLLTHPRTIGPKLLSVTECGFDPHHLRSQTINLYSDNA